jgi:hypothetical protein
MALPRTHPPALRHFGRYAVLCSLVAVALGGCSTDKRRDQNFGTDAGVIYNPPEGGVRDATANGDGGADGADAGSSRDGGAADAATDAQDSAL